jgi:hypothetical protein
MILPHWLVNLTGALAAFGGAFLLMSALFPEMNPGKKFLIALTAMAAEHFLFQGLVNTAFYWAFPVIAALMVYNSFTQEKKAGSASS